MTGDIYGLRLLRQQSMQRTIVIVIALLLVAVRLLQFAVFTGQVQWGYDFSFYFRAADALLHGASIYSPEQLAGPYAPQGQNGFLYPPPFAAFSIVFHQPWALWSLLAPGDYRAAAWAWTVTGLVILVVTVMAVSEVEGLTDRLRSSLRLGPWILVAAAIGFPPVIGELVLGNVHLLLLGLFGLAWLGIQGGTSRGEAIAGVAIGVAAVIKIFPAILIVWVALTGRRRAAYFTVLGALVAVLVTLPITGIQSWLDYPRVLANLSAPADTTDTLAPTVWLAPYLGFGVARSLVTIVGLGILAWSARRGSIRASFAAAVLISILIAPGLYHHYLAITVLPFLLLLADGVRLRWLVLAYLLMSGGTQPALGELAWIVNKGLPTLGVLVLLAVALADRRAAAAGRLGANSVAEDGS